MSESEERLRPAPAERFSGAEHQLDLTAALQALRDEPRPTGKGRKQITLLHHGPVRLVLFAFDPGGRLPEHQAPGWVTVHALRGTLRVKTPERYYTLLTGHVLALDPGVPHDVEALTEADMLLGVYPLSTIGSDTRGE